MSAQPVPFVRAVGLLVRTDLLLERRAPQLALAMGLFAAVAQVVCTTAPTSRSRRSP